jgi:excinuclease ABC subunit B
MEGFKLVSEYAPMGDQPAAIDALEASVKAGNRFSTLLGVTGSGKTFTIANLVQRLQRPTLVISHNKTLAAQLYSEFKGFFPENAVEYFVSNFDYYQPEAYIPQTDTYIEKDSAINDEIERLRIKATSALVSRRDVLVVASVSCIYGLGSPEDYKDMLITIRVGERIKRDEFLKRMVQSLYERNDIAFERGRFRVKGEIVDIFPAYMESAMRVEFWGDEVERIRPLDPVTGDCGEPVSMFQLYPASPFVTSRDKLEVAMKRIRTELTERIAELEGQNKLVEAQRIKMRTEYDLELMAEMGFCSGIENYSRHLSGRKEGERPFCLIDFFPKDFLLVIDESHASVPQIRAMYNGDRSRKERLVEYGFRLRSALDNRPLKDSEFFDEVTGQTVFVSATPAEFEMKASRVVARQEIRPTGLLDPVMDLRPGTHQVEDFISEAVKAVEAGERVLATTLTKRMSEDLTTYLRERGLKVEYLHSDIDAIERVEILRNLRHGKFDVLVGVNLLREGLDLPEVALVAILDADKEGFLRSVTSLVQTAGRAARHEKGRVLLYADNMTDSLKTAIALTNARRERQMAYNAAHGITPRGVKRADQESLRYEEEETIADPVLRGESGNDADVAAVLADMENEMLEAAENLDFERAAVIRDQIEALKGGKEGLKKYRAGGKDAQHKKRGPRSGTIYKADKFTVGKRTKKK